MTTRLLKGTCAGRDVVLASTPYHPDFVQRARALNGTWEAAPKWWRFDARDTLAVRAAILAVYGECGSAAIDRADVQYTLPASWHGAQTVYLLGREVLYRPSRDSHVKLGEGVVVHGPGFGNSGGSRFHPSVGCPTEGTILEIRDVPLTFAQAFCARQEGTEIIRVTPAAQPAAGEPDREPAGIA